VCGNPLQYARIHGSPGPRKLHKIELACTPEESSELGVRQETAAGLQPGAADLNAWPSSLTSAKCQKRTRSVHGPPHERMGSDLVFFAEVDRYHRCGRGERVAGASGHVSASSINNNVSPFPPGDAGCNATSQTPYVY
jgi:hypothetical protein